MDYGEKHYIVSSAIWAFQVLSDPRFTKHKILMTGRYLIPFILKSKSITINDRPCLGKEVKIVISTQELYIYITKFRLCYQNKSTPLPGSITQRNSFTMYSLPVGIYESCVKKECRDFNR